MNANNPTTGLTNEVKLISPIEMRKCAFILPDKKLEKVSSAKKLLNNHKLEKIIKLPEKVFFE